ncbi:MutS protein msh5 [Borealophlyctis nickersoniae]|nr:MutS protein msh5 [Borealophlyctis nickersoniae]
MYDAGGKSGGHVGEAVSVLVTQGTKDEKCPENAVKERSRAEAGAAPNFFAVDEDGEDPLAKSDTQMFELGSRCGKEDEEEPESQVFNVALTEGEQNREDVAATMQVPGKSTGANEEQLRDVNSGGEGETPGGDMEDLTQLNCENSMRAGLFWLTAKEQSRSYDLGDIWETPSPASKSKTRSYEGIMQRQNLFYDSRPTSKNAPDEEIFPDDSISVVGFRAVESGGGAATVTVNENPDESDDVTPDDGLGTSIQPATALISQSISRKTLADASVDASSSKATESPNKRFKFSPLRKKDVGNTNIPKELQPSSPEDIEDFESPPTNTVEVEHQDDDWMTIDTRVSAHSAYSLAQRIRARKGHDAKESTPQPLVPTREGHEVTPLPEPLGIPEPSTDRGTEPPSCDNLSTSPAARDASTASSISFNKEGITDHSRFGGSNLHATGSLASTSTTFSTLSGRIPSTSTTFSTPSRTRATKFPASGTLPPAGERRPVVRRLIEEESEIDSEDTASFAKMENPTKNGTMQPPPKRVRFNDVEDVRPETVVDNLETIDDELYDKVAYNVYVGEMTNSVFANNPSTNAIADPANPVRFDVEIRPSTEFFYATAKNRLLSIKLTEKLERHGKGTRENSHAENQPRTERTEMHMYLESIVSLDCTEMVGQALMERTSVYGTGAQKFTLFTKVGCAGALLSYISKARLTGEILEDGHEMEIHSVEHFNLDQFMQIGADALCSLQIFIDEAHPNMHNRNMYKKEGLSLFGILNMTRTPAGRALLRHWFLRPSVNMDILEERHATIEFFLRPDCLFVAEQLVSCLKHVKNIPKILYNLRTKASIAEWQALLKFAYYSLKMRSAVQELGETTVPILQKVCAVFVVNELKDVGTYINNVIDFDESVNEARFVVKPHVDEELDELKRTYNGLDDLLSVVAREVSTSIPQEFSRSLNVIYFPQLGYLITIPLKPEWTQQEDFLIDGLYFQFCTANTVYYKSDQMFELDETLGDIHSIIVDREIEIMQRLQETVLEYAETLRQAANVCAELDCLLALAEAARKYNYRRPRMTHENVLHIVKGRHPLQELCVDVFIGNDTKLGETEEDARAMLLTGANFSGKSVYLKQVALIVYMAHIGSFVPAESAFIGLTDKIFTRIQTRETVSKIQSAFMIDLHQVAVAVRNSTPRSLVILDEFGKGTASTGKVSLKLHVLLWGEKY